MDEYKLPAVYGKSRLVLLAVHPYLIHVYWEIASQDFDKAKEEAGEAQEVLRFYKRGMGRESSLTDSFDVEINLQAGNWYVHLWSAEESYFADLGIKSKDGTFVRALSAFSRKSEWTALMKNAMTRDFSWNRSASEYVALYNRLHRRPPEKMR